MIEIRGEKRPETFGLGMNTDNRLKTLTELNDCQEVFCGEQGDYGKPKRRGYP